MADYLTDIYPIPVEFNDGQQPTAKFFNAWATQIDNAFILISQVLGDFDGTGEADEAYVTNIIRSIGVMGWVNNRLPRGLRVDPPNGAGPDEDLPRISETLSSFEDAKIALLTFQPDADEATDGDDRIEVAVDNGEFTTAVDKWAGDSKYINLNTAGDWLLDGRRLLTTSQIDPTSRIVYAVDTAADDYRDAYGPDNGANVIPSLYEITSTLGDLCTITQPGGYAANSYRIDFPEVRRVQNPNFPQASDEGDTIQLDDAGSDVRWSGTAPLYPIPDWIYILAGSNANLIPGGLVALWHQGPGGVISRVSSIIPSDVITFELIPGTQNAVKITLNGTLALPATGEPLGAGSPADDNHNRYIVAFAGTSVTDALVHERSRMLLHKHDGHGDESLVSAEYLVDRFDPDEFYHGHGRKFNWFPQYLERGGYTASEPLNRKNAMLGNLLMGINTAAASNDVDPEDITVTSHAIRFSNIASGPKIFFDTSDTAGDSPDDEGKLILDTVAVRSIENHYFGARANGSYLTSRLSGADEILEHNAFGAVESDIIFETGMAYLRSGILSLDDSAGNGFAGTLTYTADGADNSLVTFEDDAGQEAQLRADKFVYTSEDERAVFVGPDMIMVATGLSTVAPALIGGFDNIAIPLCESTIGGNGELNLGCRLPDVASLGLSPNGDIVLETIKIHWILEDKAASTYTSDLVLASHDPTSLTLFDKTIELHWEDPLDDAVGTSGVGTEVAISTYIYGDFIDLSKVYWVGLRATVIQANTLAITGFTFTFKQVTIP